MKEIFEEYGHGVIELCSGAIMLGVIGGFFFRGDLVYWLGTFTIRLVG